MPTARCSCTWSRVKAKVHACGAQSREVPRHCALHIATGEVIKSGKPSAPKYTNVFGKVLVAEAESNADIVAITAA